MDTSSSSAHLRKVLNVMFPPSYIELYHKPPNSVCSLLNTRCVLLLPPLSSYRNHNQEQPPATRSNNNTTTNIQQHQHEASTEPSSRAGIISLREQLNSSLMEHQAKLVGLCPVRRSIFDQCFDELIRQVTVCCIEQGLLLFRIRNELRMTINCYRKAYESGVKFGLNKAINAELLLENNKAKIYQLESYKETIESNKDLEDRIVEVELKNKLESVDRMREYYKKEIVKKDQVIEQQRAIIRALSQKSIGDIQSPI